MKNKKKILLLGANGYLGARLFYDLRDKFDVTGTYHRKQFYKEFVQLDITDKDQVLRIFKQYKPNIIVHSANFPSPRHAKDNKDGYKKLNLTATEYIKDGANEIGAKVIFISSFAAFNPDNIYGKLKLESEEIVKQVKEGYLILRASLILGYSPNTSNDRPFDRILKHLDDKTVAEFDTSWTFQPTYVGHVSEMIEACINKDIFNRMLPVFCDSLETQYSTAVDILKPFNIEVKPIDKNMTIPVAPADESELIKLELPTISYQDMLNRIHDEIKNREKFIL
jgi:dTDP-4-dehydrorhamnose reductase